MSGLLLTLAVIGLAFYAAQQGATGNQPIDTIAVLPFTYTSGDTDGESLSDGITESLINSFSRAPKLSVIARTTSFSYKGAPIDLEKIARDLKVRAVVTGSVTKRGDSLTIQADLVDAQTGRQLWGEHYSRKLADVLAVQDDIVARILEGLRFKLSLEEQQRLVRHSTENAAAYQLYLQGRREVFKAISPEGFWKGLALFDQALQLDANYALAYAGKAEAYMVVSDIGVPAREAAAKTKEFALAALGLDSDLSEAHCALAQVSFLYDWDWPTAEREFRRARSLDPASACVDDVYATDIAMIGRIEEGLREAKRALQIDPRSFVRHFNLGQIMYFAGQYEQAIEEFRETETLNPNYGFAQLYRALAFEQQGKFDQAIAEFQRLAPANPAGPQDAQLMVAHALSAAGRREEALTLLRDHQGSPSLTPGSRAWIMGILHTGLGDKDQAFEWLVKARDEHFVAFPSVKVDPVFRSLRSDSRFVALIRSIGLEP
jgi:TolB-like protein/Tfp pilus assembly protein PilF